jgi:hypothetical protein
MSPLHHISNRARRLWFFFPFRLLVLHFKKNHFLLFLWLLLFGFTTGKLASGFGVPQQFLVPEYNGHTGVLAFGIVGFAVGGFITGFNLYTYIMHGYRFPFIATLSRPFHKFSINNFLLPAIFIVVYCISSAHFQITRELIDPLQAELNLLAFLGGVTLFQTLSYLYFSYTNKDANAYAKGKRRRSAASSPIDSPIHHPLRWFSKNSKVPKWHVETYLSAWNKRSLARDSNHYDKHILEQVFSQNHVNAARFELALIISFLIIGSQREHSFFLIPAAASTMLFFTLMLMLVSAIHSWIKGWTVTIFIGILLVVNFFYAELKLISIENRAFGLNYDVARAEYIPAKLAPSADTVQKDINFQLEVLDQWRKKLNPEIFETGKKPKLVIIDCSGGGSRSAYWTMRSLALADSLSGGKLLNHTVLMTGASGGMLGSALLRELKLRQALGESVSPHNHHYSDLLAEDLLNPVILSMSTNDWFIRYQKLKDGDYTYTKDRGWAFEKQLNENTEGLLDKRLGHYYEAERKALIPMLVLSPTIINDGRRLLIASQPISYLTQNMGLNYDPNPQPENLEFSRTFANQDAQNLRFISALRMNATFPYVMPVASLPSTPTMEIMDAGLRDNFGLKTTAQYLHTFKNWINTNTSGVVIVQVRDLPKGVDLGGRSESWFGKLMAPLGGITGNLTKTQDYTNEQFLHYLNDSFDQKIELVTLQLQQSNESAVSLSWHLTKSEKEHIRQATQDPYFQQEITRLLALLK